jgi:hypothetical protein
MVYEIRIGTNQPILQRLLRNILVKTPLLLMFSKVEKGSSNPDA